MRSRVRRSEQWWRLLLPLISIRHSAALPPSPHPHPNACGKVTGGHDPLHSKQKQTAARVIWPDVSDATPRLSAVVSMLSIIHSGVREVIRKSSPATQNRLLLSVSWIFICSSLCCQEKCWMLAPQQLPWLDSSQLTIHQKQTTAPLKPSSCVTKLIPPGTLIFAFLAAAGFTHVSASFELQVSGSPQISLPGFELTTLWTPGRSYSLSWFCLTDLATSFPAG